MHDSAVEGSNPETAIPIAQHPSAADWFICAALNRIRLGLSINQPVNAATPANEQRAVLVFTEALNAVWLARERIEFRWSRFPLPRSEERRVGKECRSRWSPYH